MFQDLTGGTVDKQLPQYRTWVRYLVQEDPHVLRCCFMRRQYWYHVIQLLKLANSITCNKKSRCSEKSLLAENQRKPVCRNEDPARQK